MKINRLKSKLEKVTTKDGVFLDEETSNDLRSIMDEEGEKMKEMYPDSKRNLQQDLVVACAGIL